MADVGLRKVGDAGLNRACLPRSLGLAAAFAVLLGACAPEESQEAETEAAPEPSTFEWKLVTTWPKNLPGLGTAPGAARGNGGCHVGRPAQDQGIRRQ